MHRLENNLATVAGAPPQEAADYPDRSVHPHHRQRGGLRRAGFAALLAAVTGFSAAACSSETSSNPASSGSSANASSSQGASSTTNSSPVSNPASSQTQSTQSTTAMCAYDKTQVGVGSPNGAAGSIYMPIQFTNEGSTPCWLEGYPGVSAIGINGGQLGPAATKNTGVQPTTITLNPSATATAELRITDAGNYSTDTCDPQQSTGLKIYPPGSTGAQMIPHPFTACGKIAILLIGPVTLQSS